jgi:hypothetical protein
MLLSRMWTIDIVSPTLRRWGGNIVTATLQQIIYDCPFTWFGCHWSEWPEIAMITQIQYYQARRMLVSMGKLRVERINIPWQRQYVLCHTLDMDAEPPEPGVNLYIWGKDNV